MIIPPCKNCSDRKIPKTCQKNCERWNEYQTRKKELQELIKQNKKIEQRIMDSIWRKK